VAEIAYRVGFGSPAYFNKCFRDCYGYPPGEVIRLAHKKEGAFIHPSRSWNQRGSQKDPPQQNKKIRRSLSMRYVLSILTGMISLIVVSGYLFKRIRTDSLSATSRGKSIAVLQFHNESPDPDNEYFCNGMVDEIITHLQKIKDIRVKSRTSTESLKNLGKDLIRIARELEVAHILDGSVRKSGEDLRI
jgi:hypothetical protein